MSNARAASQHLRDSWRMLCKEWQITREEWRDIVQHDFERLYWQKFDAGIPRIINKMETLATTIEKARLEVP